MHIVSPANPLHYYAGPTNQGASHPQVIPHSEVPPHSPHPQVPPHPQGPKIRAGEYGVYACN